MSKMFSSYEQRVLNMPCTPPPVCEFINEPKMVTNIKGEVLGVQLDQTSPFQLYFHLENACEIELNELLAGVALFEILTTTHKVCIEREYQVADILDPYSNDLNIFLTPEETKSLKKETYNMRVTLKTAENTFVVFTEKDGYLIIR